MTDSVLFIGVGKMGGAMAMRLLEAGTSLAVADIAPAALGPFVQRGVPVAESSGDLPGDVVVTMLPTEAHVRQAVLGEGGAMRGRKRRVLIDMTSASPTGTRSLAQDLREMGVEMLDAPVSGGVAGARIGDLTAMVGGDAAVFARYEPLLRQICTRVRHVGPIGAGDAMKALNNYLSAIALWASSEALLIGARAGLDPRTMVDVWQSGSARSHAIEAKMPRAILPRTFDYGMTLQLFAKDVAIAARLARDLDVPAPALAATEENWRLAKGALGGEQDITTILRLLESWAGYEVPQA